MWNRYRPTDGQPWNLRRVAHLHRRAGFAATWGELQRDLQEGPDRAIARFMDGTVIAGDTVASIEAMSAVIVEAAVGSNNINRLKAWWLYRMLFSPDPLGERLTLSWHNHFATSNEKVSDVGLMCQQNALFRQYARAPFRELLTRVSKDPALLVWLDADANRKEHPNENLAREMMELFSLGVGNYSEADIKNAARSLTGWTVSRSKFLEDGQYHDQDQKTIFGKSGNWSGDDFVWMLVEHPATARRIAFRICELFMGENSYDDAANEELSKGLRERNLDIHWAVETVLRSEEFFSNANIGNRVLGPTEFIVGAARALERFQPPPSTLLLAEWTAILGQDLFNPPNVFGWPGGRSWLSSRAIVARANFALALRDGLLCTPAAPFDATAFAQAHGFTGAKQAGSFFAQLMLGQPQLPETLQKYSAQPDQLVTAILASPEGQLA